MKRTSQNLCWGDDFTDVYTVKKTPKKKVVRGKKVPTRNPFLNFLRDFRNWNPRLASSQLMQKGGEFWRTMTDKQKQLYWRLARTAPIKKKKVVTKGKRGGKKNVKITKARRA